MLETKGNLWEQEADAFVITTNAVLTWRNGDPYAVMGKGCALEAKRMFPGIDAHLGWLIMCRGSQVYNLGEWGKDFNTTIISMPTKNHYSDKSTMKHVTFGSRQLVKIANENPVWANIAMPRPGCGFGGLRWEDVRPVLAEILDNRFVVVSF
jgi:hypothetical protein